MNMNTMSTVWDRINGTDTIGTKAKKSVKPELKMDTASKYDRLTASAKKALDVLVIDGYEKVSAKNITALKDAGFIVVGNQFHDVTEEGYAAVGKEKPDFRSVDEKIRDGFYETKLPHPAFRDFPLRMKDPAFIKARDIYNDDVRRLHEQFMLDLFKEHGVENNPKREKCYALAYEHGHSSGKSEVSSYFSEFVELIK